MVMEVRPLQPSKQLSPTLVTEFGMVIDVKLLQSFKQYHPKVVIVFGMVMEVKLLQPLYLLLVDYQYFTP